MSWANHYIAKLKTGATVSFRPRGNSMTGKISSGQLCTLAPITDPATLKTGDIVLFWWCPLLRSGRPPVGGVPSGADRLRGTTARHSKVAGNQYLHLITAIQGTRFQISNNHGRINGWTTFASIYEKCISVQP